MPLCFIPTGWETCFYTFYSLDKTKEQMGAMYHSIPYTDHGPDTLTVTMGMLVFMLLGLHPGYRDIVTYKELVRQDKEYRLASHIHA